MDEKDGQFDVIIIGGGAAGMSAALWCDELGLATLLLEKEAELGGQLLSVHNPLENHLGVTTPDGRRLRDIFLGQVGKRGFLKRLGAQVGAVDAAAKRVFVRGGEELAARALVVATGVRRRKLGVAGEDDWAGRGMLDSGRTDAGAVRGQSVLIVGGGDAALENALLLAETAGKVYVAHRRARFRARAEFLERARRDPKIELLAGQVVREISGGPRIGGVLLRGPSGETRLLPVDALLVRIGVEPNTEIFAGQLDLDEGGYVRVDSRCETSAPGVYAAGDAASPLAPTVSGAVGTGATAAKAIFARFSAEAPAAE